PTGTYTAITAGNNHTCALKTDNTITCWGNNHHNQTNTPTGTYTAITAGNNHTCALLKTDNTITCWGFGITLPAPSVGVEWDD
ncbi:MAG: RCC1 domain-containing protein, partial [Acidimicrobiaceae bacterium]|nr:RCC1 domain-containing protein [Acidimicrobiaceae bacterium]